MNKLKMFVALTVALLIASPVMAAVEVAVAPQAGYHVYSNDSLENSLGAGVQVSIKDVFVDNLVVFSGLEFVSTDFATSLNSLDQVVWSNGVGYSLAGILGVANLDVVPFVSGDAYFTSSDTLSVENTYGFSVGTTASYAVKDNVSVFATVKYSSADADSSIGNIDLDNVGLVAGVSIKL